MTHFPYRHPNRYLIDVQSPISVSHIDLSYQYRIISCHSGPYFKAKKAKADIDEDAVADLDEDAAADLD
jgi:hypothetical protein